MSNASMWDTLKLLPPHAVPDSYRQQVERTPANRSFMHLHLGFDAAGELARSLWGRFRCEAALHMLVPACAAPDPAATPSRSLAASVS